jgi:hypothetical protein
MPPYKKESTRSQLLTMLYAPSHGVSPCTDDIDVPITCKATTKNGMTNNRLLLGQARLVQGRGNTHHLCRPSGRRTHWLLGCWLCHRKTYTKRWHTQAHQMGTRKQIRWAQRLGRRKGRILRETFQRLACTEFQCKVGSVSEGREEGRECIA